MDWWTFCMKHNSTSYKNVHVSTLLQCHKTTNPPVPVKCICQFLLTCASEVYVSVFPPVPLKCMSGSFHLCQWCVYQFFPPVPVKCMSISSHMCQWSVCQCLPTCTTEVYVRFFPSVPMTCISVLRQILKIIHNSGIGCKNPFVLYHTLHWHMWEEIDIHFIGTGGKNWYTRHWHRWKEPDIHFSGTGGMIFKICQWCGRAGFSFKSFFHMFLTLKFQYCLYLVFFMGCLCLILKLFLEKGYKAMQKISTWYELYCIHAII
jgi:hypothetical protein